MNEPVRVLQVFAGMNRGGAENMIMNLYRNIDRSKVQFDFIVHTYDKCSFDKEIEELGGRIYRVPRYNGKNHFSYKKAWVDFFEKHPEYIILHGHIRSTASIYLRIAKRFDLITIIHSHSTASRGNGVEKLIKNIMQIPIRYISDYFLACSDEAGKWLFGKKVVNKNNYMLLKNAINLDKYLFDNVKRNELRKVMNLENKLVIGHVGSFTDPKNHKFLINLFYEVQKRKEAELILIGDGNLRESMEMYIKKLNLEKKVRIIGEVSNVNDYLNAMDIFVFPSFFEGLGLSVIEAQSNGLKCLISNGIPNEVVVTDLVTKLSLEESVEIWVKKLLIVATELKYDRQKYSEIVSSKGYDILEVSSILEKFYEDLLNKRV